MVLRRVCAPALLAALFTGCAADKAKQDEAAADASAPVWTLSTKSDEARKDIEAGERLNDEGYALKAYDQFKRAVAADSAFAYAYLRVGETGTAAGLSTDEWTTNLKRAEAYETTANATERLLIEYDRKTLDNDLQGALDVARQLTVAEPKNPRSWWNLGGTQQGLNQTADSRASFDTALALAPMNGFAHLLLAASYVLNEPRDFPKAEQYALEGVKLWPNQPISYNYLGALRRAQGQLDSAVAAYTRMVELDPQQATAHALRGNGNTFLGRYDSARADYDAALRVGRGPELGFLPTTRAFISAYQGDPNAAIKEIQTFTQAIDGLALVDPDGAKAVAFQAEAILAMYTRQFKVADTAVAEYAKWSRKVADKTASPAVRRLADANIAYLEGDVAAFKGDYATAEQKAAEIVALRGADHDPTKDWPVHAVRGYVALFQKQYATAVTELDRSDPVDKLVMYHRALALEGAGRAADAKALFQKIATYNFTDPNYAAVRNDAIARAKGG